MASSITFAISDGDATHRPGGDTKYSVAPREAQVNYKAKVGKWIGSRLEGSKPGMLYTIKNFPAGYELYQKTRSKNPGAKQHIDRYLFGHPDRYVFLSTNEFAPHALWLANGKKGKCACIGCNGKRSRKAVAKSQTSGFATSTLLTSDASASKSDRAQFGISGSAAQIQNRRESIFTKYLTELRTQREMDVSIKERNHNPWRSEPQDFKYSLKAMPGQGAFIHRVGEIILFRRSDLSDGSPQPWQAGIIQALPWSTEEVLQISKITAPNQGKPRSQLGFYCFKVKHLYNVEDGLSAWYFLSDIRPFCFYRELLAVTPKKKWHPSISHAMSKMSTFSLALPLKFIGSWPDAWILHGGIYLGSELIIAGDAVRIATSPSPTNETITPAVLVVTSITLMFQNLDLDPPYYTSVTGDTCKGISVRLHGKLFTRYQSAGSSGSISERKRCGKEKEKVGEEEENCELRLPPSMRDSSGGTAGWYPADCDEEMVHYVPLSLVLGRLYEPEAVERYELSAGLPSSSTSFTNFGDRIGGNNSGIVGETGDRLPMEEHGVQGVLKARAYARKHEGRISILGAEAGSWFWANDRAEGLATPPEPVNRSDGGSGGNSDDRRRNSRATASRLDRVEV